MSTKKFVSTALAATTSLWLSGAMLLVPTASAQSADALQSQIAALLAQIATLQAQLNGGTSGSTAGAYTFTKDLTLGAKGADVTALQNMLIAGGYLKASATGYFGSMTKAAVVAWQKAKGLSPASGYFGPKSRAVANVSGGATGGNTGGVTPPASGLAVSLAADSMTGSAISGAGQIKVGKFNFTASNSGGVTITGLEFKKVGVLSDSSISNLYLADAVTGEIVAQYQSLTNGVATFANVAVNVAAGQTWAGELRMDLASGVSAGNTIAWQLSKVVTAGNSTVTGAPTTNALTVTSVSNPSLATVSVSETIPGTSADVAVDAGTASALVSSWNANVAYSPVNLTNMQFQFVGSANPADIKNLVLKVNGTQVATLPYASVNTNFNFASNPVRLGTGNSVIELYADVMGSPNRNFRFSLLQPYRVGAIDTQYNTGISPSVTNGTKNITINTGSVTLSLASDSPTGNLPNGAANLTLAKFRVYAAGEPIKVKYLAATITGAGGTGFTNAASVKLNNVKLVDDAGGQVGNTISTVGNTSNSGDCSIDSTTVLTCRFGVASSPINYIVPANTARVLSLVVDIASSNDRTSYKGAMVAGSSNLEGQISYQPANSGAATGATRAVTTQPLSAVANSGFAAPTYAAGAAGVKIASFVISAASAEGAKISSLTFDKDNNANPKLQSLKVMIGTTQFGATRATVNDAESAMAFSASSPVNVPSGGSVTVDVYADILSTSAATTTGAVIDLTGWSALGATSNSSISFGTAVDGQDITVSSGPTLTVSRASESAATKQVVMGSTGNSLFTIRLNNDNVEDVRVTQINLMDTIGSGATNKASFQNLGLYDAGTLIAGPRSLVLSSAASGTLQFSISGDGVIVPKLGSKNLELKGDVASIPSNGAVSGSTHNFSLQDNATSSVIAFGKDSGSAVTIALGSTSNSNTSTVYRTKVTLSSSLLGAGSLRTRTAVDDVATLNFAANSSYQAVLNTVTLKFDGGALNTTSTFSVSLLDATTNALLGSATAQTCSPSAQSCSVTFSPNFTIDAGTTKATKVRVSSANFANGSQSDSLSVSVNAATDVLINDGSVGSVPLESTVVPFPVVTVSYE